MPSDDLQDKYTAQFQIALLQRLDYIIQLLENIQNEMTILGADAVIPKELLDDVDWDNSDEDKASA